MSFLLKVVIIMNSTQKLLNAILKENTKRFTFNNGKKLYSLENQTAYNQLLRYLQFILSKIFNNLYAGNKIQL